MTDPPSFAAVDLGASSGRVVVGRVDDGRVALNVVHRFPNRPVCLPDGLHWNLLHLFTETLEGLRQAGPVNGVGVDAWGVDYALLDERNRVLGLPFHYRDGRTAGMIERAFARVPATEMYAATGTQTLPINSVFQLLADEGTAALAAAQRIALVPDLFALWLSGTAANERTAASTTGLLAAATGEWALSVIERLGLPLGPFRELVEPGTELGLVREEHDLSPAPVYAVAGHDTASAFAAAPVQDEHAAILSSGTWSLLGLELPAPVLTEAAREANLTNERGVDGSTRLLKNVMGLWIEQECARTWGASFDELHALASAVTGDVPLFDPDDEAFLPPGDMPARIAEALTESGQAAPGQRGALVRSIHLSLVCKYRWVLERLEAVSGRDVRCIHIIGGGARNSSLCAMTADVTGRQVIAGPVEATALGNVLVQARAAGELETLRDLREVVAASIDPTIYEPDADRSRADETYRRFLDVTGLAAPISA